MDAKKLNAAVKIRLALMRAGLKNETRARFEKDLTRLTDTFTGEEFAEYVKRIR